MKFGKLSIASFILQSLVAYRSEICSKLGLSLTDVELSMGMSADFVQAVSILVSVLPQKHEYYAIYWLCWTMEHSNDRTRI